MGGNEYLDFIEYLTNLIEKNDERFSFQCSGLDTMYVYDNKTNKTLMINVRE